MTPNLNYAPMVLSATNKNEPYLPLPIQPKLVLIYRPRRDERLSKKSIQDRCTPHWASECTEQVHRYYPKAQRSEVKPARLSINPAHLSIKTSRTGIYILLMLYLHLSFEKMHGFKVTERVGYIYTIYSQYSRNATIGFFYSNFWSFSSHLIVKNGM